uniref:Tetratricopeptide repeat protein n=1 Tax=Timema douglasi TaxID=61478 RepID=A0A7R8VRI4_TIMDO|nr:unnamed protein product [Timema douglasi]
MTSNAVRKALPIINIAGTPPVKEEFKKAEQMLHLALKLAQQQQNDQAVTYIYDLMANLAYDTDDFSKAETLFVNVLQRLIASGAQHDDNRVLHISYKMADIYKKMGNIEKAEQGFQFCTERLENKLRVSPDEDTTLLLAMTLDAHARLLLDTRRLDQAFTCYQRAYFLAGDTHEQTAVLLNDLGTVSFLRGDLDTALMYVYDCLESEEYHGYCKENEEYQGYCQEDEDYHGYCLESEEYHGYCLESEEYHGYCLESEGISRYLNRAVEVGDQQHLAAVYVNMGSLYLQKQMVDEAKRSCELGWSSANKHGDKEAMDEASLCLQEVKGLMQDKKEDGLAYRFCPSLLVTARLHATTSRHDSFQTDLRDHSSLLTSNCASPKKIIDSRYAQVGCLPTAVIGR